MIKLMFIIYFFLLMFATNLCIRNVVRGGHWNELYGMNGSMEVSKFMTQHTHTHTPVDHL